MFDLRHAGMYENKRDQITRANDGYVFKTEIPTVRIPSRSPYYVGARKWNTLPEIFETLIPNLGSKLNSETFQSEMWE